MKHSFFSVQIFVAVLATIFFSCITIVLFEKVLFSQNSDTENQFLFVGSTPYSTVPAALLTPNENATTSSLDSGIVTAQPSVTFVGDIMLARSVELWMQGSGMSYPFLHVRSILGSSSIAFANFEAAIPVNHEHTLAYSTRFSTDAKYIAELAKSGITHVSLANNHAFDFGSVGEENTRAVLIANGLVPFGNANAISSSSITYTHLGSTTIGFIALQNVYGKIDYTALQQEIAIMSENSDLQIAFVHWGTEYQLSHDAAQETLANYLVSQGIDAIIGHHPHVVEDIQLVHGVPVFYSLGNFIFDQYFSDAVQQGLTLRLTVNNGVAVFTLVPSTSIGTHAQPRIMEESERGEFLTHLSKRSSAELSSQIVTGEITLPFFLQNR
jgi:poly-gamma-glutamate synthesis protein (capsule biosynthesis protein)